MHDTPASVPSTPRMTIGVMGSAADDPAPEVLALSYALGQAIARNGCTLINGACHGYPYHAAHGAKDAGGITVGISPALSLDQHLHHYGSPADYLDVIVYTGSGLMGREVTNIRSSDIVVIVGGRSGTLGEFAIAYDEGKLIGVLEGSGGITEALPAIVDLCNKDSGAHLIYDSNPESLIERLIAYYHQHHCQHPSCFHEPHERPQAVLG